MTHICNKMNRRAFGGGALAIVLARPALALNADDATAFIKRLIGDIYSVIDSGAPEAAMIRQFEELFAPDKRTEVSVQCCICRLYCQKIWQEIPAIHWRPDRSGRSAQDKGWL